MREEAADDDWSRAARGFEKISSGLYAGATAPFFAFAGLKPGMSVLDAACGPGTSTRLAAARLGAAGTVLGVDHSPAMLALAKRASRRDARVGFALADAERLELPSACFDAVVCHLGLMLFARPAKALRELVRVARPGAPVSCLVLGAASRMPFTSMVSGAAGPGLHAFGEPRALRAALEKAGLRAVATRRLRGRLRVASKRAYWTLVAEGFGRIGPLIRALPLAQRRAFKREVYARAAAFENRRGSLAIPYEFTLARGRKPAR